MKSSVDEITEDLMRKQGKLRSRFMFLLGCSLTALGLFFYSLYMIHPWLVPTIGSVVAMNLLSTRFQKLSEDQRELGVKIANYYEGLKSWVFQGQPGKDVN